MSLPGHDCGPPYQLKVNGSCLCCREVVYTVIDFYPDDAPPEFAGTPRRVNRPLPRATQVMLLLSDGSIADITFCIDCANELRPAHYMAVWNACTDRLALSLRLAGRSANEQKAHLAAAAAVWPIAMAGKRCEGLEPGSLLIDRR